MESCQPTPDEVKAFAVAHLRAAIDELTQAARALRSLPSVKELAGPVDIAREAVAAVANSINPFA